MLPPPTSLAEETGRCAPEAPLWLLQTLMAEPAAAAPAPTPAGMKKAGSGRGKKLVEEEEEEEEEEDALPVKPTAPAYRPRLILFLLYSLPNTACFPPLLLLVTLSPCSFACSSCLPLLIIHL